MPPDDNNAATRHEIASWRQRHLEDYARLPETILKKATRIAEAEIPQRDPDRRRYLIALRIIRAIAEPGIATDLVFSHDAITQGIRALQANPVIFADCAMVVAGISRGPFHDAVRCTLYRPGIAEYAAARQLTRSAAAVDDWVPHLEGAIVVIGNAPTALFHLLELIADGAPHPALILGFPVGFVGACEAKQALIENPFALPFITLKGRRGGSALAAAAVNGLAEHAAPDN